MNLNNEKLGFYFADFVFCGGFQKATPAKHEGPLYLHCDDSFLGPSPGTWENERPGLHPVVGLINHTIRILCIHLQQSNFPVSL